MKLVAVQHAHPSDPRRDVPRVLQRAARAVEDGGIAVLPEYFYKPAGMLPTRDELKQLGWIEEAVVDASRTTEGTLVATVPELGPGEQVHNTAIVTAGGSVELRQRKIRPTEREREAGVQGSKGLRVATVGSVRVGVLVCADVLALDLLAAMAELEPDVVAVPVLSPNRVDDITRAARTSVFVARAWDLGAYVVKAGGFAEDRIVGRSLITAPWGLLADSPGDFEAAMLSAPYEADKLARARDPFVGLGEP